MELKENNIKDLSVDLEQSQETLKKISGIAKSLVEVISDTFTEFWDKINGDTILQYKKLYNQSQYKYIKKGKKYVKARRHNSEDISKVFLRKISHYSKKINQYKN